MVAWLRNDFFKVLSKLSEFCSHPVTHVSHIMNQAIAWLPVIRAAYFLSHIKEHRILCQGSKYQSFIARHCRAMIFSFWGVKNVRILFTLFLKIPLIFLRNCRDEETVNRAHSIGEALIVKKKCSTITTTGLDIRKGPSFTSCKWENSPI